MIDAYVWTTPNGFKLLIALEELALPYEAHWVDISKGEQLRPEFLAINPNNKIPAIRDRQGPGGAPLSVFESGAVLAYLADKAGRLMGEGAQRYATLEWLFFNAGGTGPTLGQLGYYTRFAKDEPPAVLEAGKARFGKEAERLFGVLDRRLAASPYLAGDELSVADIMNFTWPSAARTLLGLDLSAHRHLSRWLDELAARPAFARALALKPPR